MSLLEAVRRFFTEQLSTTMDRPILTSTDKLVVAVSGGPDSLALLHLLYHTNHHPRQNLVVAHLDHSLRPSSAQEALYVSSIAADWGLAIFTEKVDVAGLAREKGYSLEEAGRLARYEFLGRAALEVGAPAVATAHHAGDQAETVLMNFLRGAGPNGLRGMAAVSPLPGKEGVMLIRPLLHVEKQEIENYCQREELKPLIDQSNLDISFTRNRIRHQLLPSLADYSPQIRAHLQQTAAIMGAVSSLLAELTERAWTEISVEQGSGRLSLDLAGWRQLPLALQRSIIRKAVRELLPATQDIGFRSVEQARMIAWKGRVSDRSTLPGGIVMEISYDNLVIILKEGQISVPPLPQLMSGTPMTLPIPGRLRLAGGWEVSAEELEDIDYDRVTTNADPWLAFIDADSLSTLTVRARRPGERFQPLGLAGQTASLKALMINRKIPARLRPLWPIVATEEHLVWILGHHLDQRICCRGDSKRVVLLQAERSAGVDDL